MTGGGSAVVAGLLGSLAAGAATGVGAFPVLAARSPGERLQTLMLAFAAGVMLGASFFSLIIPALDLSGAMVSASWIASAMVVAGILAGSGCIAGAEHWLSQQAVPMLGNSAAHGANDRRRRIWLFVAAISLHNLPEGLAVGVSFGGGDIAQGGATALGIGIQNMPEGLAVAVSLMSLGYSRLTATLGALATGLVEPVGGAFGAAMVSIAQPLLPLGLAFAAGAMIHVVVAEIVPDVRERGGGLAGTAALMIGLVIMMFLDTVLQ
ncbi:ZIP family zinc transporter [Sphingomonas zeicaulis]|uniref:ZIP family metal transporter n=1 Tax=Sphingomonas zeicaulis TaxID=1632740 RepID=UPI003D216DF5